MRLEERWSGGQALSRFLTRAPSLTISFGVRLLVGQVMRSENMRLQHEKSTVSLSRWQFVVCVWLRDLTLHPPFPRYDPIDCPWRLPSPRLALLLHLRRISILLLPAVGFPAVDRCWRRLRITSKRSSRTRSCLTSSETLSRSVSLKLSVSLCFWCCCDEHQSRWAGKGPIQRSLGVQEGEEGLAITRSKRQGQD